MMIYPRTCIFRQLYQNNKKQGQYFTKLPGPPVAKALPEPTNRPAPIAPPDKVKLVIDIRLKEAGLNTNRNHLHVTALQLASKRRRMHQNSGISCLDIAMRKC